MRFGFPHLDKHSLVSWALFRLSPPIDKRIKGVVVKLTHVILKTNDWKCMSTHTVPEKGSEQPICPGEGHILPVITQAQSLGGMSMPVNKKPAL